MSPMPLTDAVFLLVEKRENPMHVGGLQLFTLPEGAGPDYVSEAYRRLLTFDDVQPRFRRWPRRSLASLGQWSWAVDDDVDLEYHARLSALPRPGRVRELLELTSRLHGTMLDRRRPLWEFHLIEGITGNRFATYSKMHHALIDGVSALRLLGRTLSEDPAARDMPPPWAVPSPRRRQEPTEPDDVLTASIRAAMAAASAASQLAGVGPVLAKLVDQALREHEPASPLPLQAPKSILNVPISGARRFAAQSWPLERLHLVRTALGGTVNDVVLAMCAGALRRYLLELDALPDRPLVAMVPMSLRTTGGEHDPAGDPAGSSAGNAVGTILCSLGTTGSDPAKRYEHIRTSMLRGKQVFAGLTPLQVTALSALVMAPLAATPLPGVVRFTPPPFNVVISNVPGPTRPMYWNGARLEGIYPLSIPVDGQALNITVTSYADNVEFGLTGCRRSVPHLQRLLRHLEATLTELEQAAAVS